MRAVIYTRVSSDPKALFRSVSEQEIECRDFARRKDWDVLQVFTDNDRSASRHAKQARPGYEALIRLIESGEVDVLITWESTRAQRDMEGYVHLRETCRSADVLWAYSGRTYDMSRTDDRFSTGLDGLVAERESDAARDRILRAVKANAIAGRPHGPIPYGYAREYDPASGALLRQVIREDQAAIVRECADRFLRGETPYAIAKDLNARGIAPPRPFKGKGPERVRDETAEWNLSQIRRTLTNPRYIARRVHRGEEIGAADWPSILTESTFIRCKARFADPARKTSNEHAIKFLLSGLAKCGVCGARIKVGRPRGLSTYYCSAQSCVARVVHKVDDLVERLVIARLSEPDSLAVLTPNQGSGTSDAIGQIAEKRARLLTFYDSAAEGSLTPGALARIEARLIPEIASLERQVRRLDVPSVVYDLAASPAVVWADLALSQRRLVLDTLMEVRILKTRQGARTLDPRSIDVRWRALHEGDRPVLA